jgi:hypothetical protein
VWLRRDGRTVRAVNDSGRANILYLPRVALQTQPRAKALQANNLNRGIDAEKYETEHPSVNLKSS